MAEEARFSFAADLQSRDGALTKDARIHNGFVEKEGGGMRVWQRPVLGSGVLDTSGGQGQGMIVLDDTLYTVVGGTMKSYPPALTINAAVNPLSTSTVASGYTALLGGYMYRLNFVTGTIYRAAPTNTLSWQAVGVSTMLPSPSNNVSITEGLGYIWGYMKNGAYDVSRSTDGLSWTALSAFSDVNFSHRMASFNAAVYAFNNTFTNGAVVSVFGTGTSITAGTMTMAAGVSIDAPLINSGGGYLWAAGNISGGTNLLIARSSNGTGWTVVSTGTQQNVNVFNVNRMAYWSGQMLAVAGTGTSASILSLGAGTAPFSLGSFSIGTNANYRALMPVNNNLYILMNHTLVGVHGKFGISTAINTSPSSSIPVSPSVGPRGILLGGTGRQIIFQGNDTATLYDITSGTSGLLTGTNFPAAMVPGMVYLDQTYYVMDTEGVIWNSTGAADDPTTWPTDGFISASFEPDMGVALAKALNYVVALGQWSIELFWDAGNATGSPLSPVNNGVLLIGCASAGSIAQTESTLIFMAQRKGGGSTAQRGRFIAMLVGTSYEELSNPSVGRVLDSDDLATVYASVVELGGHTWYILGLGTSALTLVYDLKQKVWYTWSRLANGTGVTITALTQTNGVATGTAASHGISDGDPAVISGATPAGYNGTLNVSVTTSASAFSYPVSSAISGTGTGASMSITPYTESFFDSVAVAGLGSLQLIQDSTGSVYTFSLNSRLDVGAIPINCKYRTNNLDNGNRDNKFCHAVTVLGDILSSVEYGLLRHTDDDFKSYSYYRRFDLSQEKCDEHRFGIYRRRAWEWRFTGTSQHRIEAMEPDLTQGVT